MAYPINLSGKVALVTGASRGIGRAVAERLAEAGAAVALNSTTDDSALAAEIGAMYGVPCWSLPGDVAEAAAVTDLYKQLLQKAGRLDILVANAGILDDARIGMISAASIQKTLAVNVAGVLHHLQMAARLMKRNGPEGGSMIAMSSIIATKGNVGQTLYGASKAALVGMVLSAAKELAPDQIRVNALAPGYIETAMTADLPDSAKAAHLAAIGMGRAGLPADVADAALFLASPLSRYVTGQVIGVDGGMVI
jgi:3-oxoacyl-[acyl-carrier protein] reductase